MLLLCNDDGIDAPGLSALAAAVADLGPAVILAPDRHLSGCGHQATTQRPLQLTEVAPQRYMLDGTPADCTRVGLTVLAPQTAWVLSGINAGGNLGCDVYMSGTVAAAREAALLGKPAIALSHYIRRGLEVDWDQAAVWGAHVVRLLMSRPLAPGDYWNVNFPHLADSTALPDCVDCRLDAHAMPVQYVESGGRLHYRGNYHERPRSPGSDIEVCFSGSISITRLTIHNAS